MVFMPGHFWNKQPSLLEPVYLLVKRSPDTASLARQSHTGRPIARSEQGIELPGVDETQAALQSVPANEVEIRQAGESASRL